MNKNPLLIKRKIAMGFPRRGFVDSLALAAAVLVTIGAVSTQAATDLRMPITATPIYKGIGGHKSNQMLQPPPAKRKFLAIN